MSSLFSFGGNVTPSYDTRNRNSGWANLGDISSFGNSSGKNYLNQGAGFYSDILSGDPSKIATAIAPEADIIRGQAQQRKNQLAQFSNRSGGTGGAAQMIDTESQGAIDKLINSLIPTAASNLEGVGTNLLGLSSGTSSDLARQAEQARLNDIQSQLGLGKGLFGMLTGGLSNLDFTGGSSILENLGNFATGAFG